ncbi:hypothetical protein BC939DRAFT_451974 [Gamsiella multidivaricata]|uniref:uncharacterized protein n=1 Tax=Gamsiella multidivaricata TaxID=101098 RepID=UPI00221EEE0A|nr:uncharacterized protein BC939DRAFT_451974 [Gamsiella multidivaricata]KAG0367609.1 hypothetical protein BGZ54_003608 [Gamsiella multidivaricata]KAI7823390.1 hypothetical protein BC939DRAFT_451974 [Gamsiella multidivaricata]
MTLKSEKITLGVFIGATAVVAVPVTVTLAAWGAGFSIGGISAGTWATGFMASYKGAVASGSACAALQSIGAGTLLAAGTTAVCATGGGAVGGIVAAALTSGEDENGGKGSSKEASG